MKSRTANFFRWTTIAVALLLAMGAVQDASALTIVRNFSGGAAPGNAAGGGNLRDIFNTAADWWEEAILDSHIVAIDFSWAPLGGGGRDARRSGSALTRRLDATSGRMEYGSRLGVST